MIFQEPKLEVVEFDMVDIMTDSTCNQQTDQCPDTVSKEKPAVQTCSTGAFQDQDCPDDPTKLW